MEGQQLGQHLPVIRLDREVDPLVERRLLKAGPRAQDPPAADARAHHDHDAAAPMIGAAALVGPQPAAELAEGDDGDAALIGGDVVPEGAERAREALHVILEPALLALMRIPSARVHARHGQPHARLDKPRNRAQAPANVAGFVVAFLLFEIGREFAVRAARQLGRNQLGRLERAKPAAPAAPGARL